jgi:3-oxoacyl-[acyl-carrier protein] reductase
MADGVGGGEIRLDDKVAWVTGSSRGIGRAISDYLASIGAAVVVHGSTPHSPRAFNEADSLASVAEAIATGHGVETLAVYGDLGDPVAVQRIVSEIRQRFERIDVVINCAGGDIGAGGTSAPNGGMPDPNDAIHISLADAHAVLDRNLWSCIHVCREVAPLMIARKSGAIVNIASDAGLHGQAREVIYATAKAAVIEYTRCLAVQMRPFDVRVNVISPGPIVSQRFVNSRKTDSSRMVHEGTLERYGWPEEVARTAGFLASPAASYISGQVLRVDGGIQCWPG